MLVRGRHQVAAPRGPRRRALQLLARYPRGSPAGARPLQEVVRRGGRGYEEGEGPRLQPPLGMPFGYQGTRDSHRHAQGPRGYHARG